MDCLRKEYEQHMKTVVDQFASMVNMEKMYYAYANWLQEGSSNRYNFRLPTPSVLFEMCLDGDFDRKGVKENFNKNQQSALSWLKENTISFDEFKKQYD